MIEGRIVVTVAPITHSPPTNEGDAIEIPAALIAHLGIDDLRSWIVVTETNDFLWPGPDPAASKNGRTRKQMVSDTVSMTMEATVASQLPATVSEGDP